MGRGRQKIDIKKINRKDYRQVTFSKRRAGLFKKASALSTLCGAEIAMIVFSPAGRVSTFGHPSVESVIERFLINEKDQPSEVGVPSADAYPATCFPELYRQYKEELKLLEEEKKRAQELKESTSKAEPWWEAPIENMGLLELQQFKISLEELKRNVGKRTEELEAKDTVTSPFLSVNSMGERGYFAADEATQNPISPIIPFEDTVTSLFSYFNSMEEMGYFAADEAPQNPTSASSIIPYEDTATSPFMSMEDWGYFAADGAPQNPTNVRPIIPYEDTVTSPFSSSSSEEEWDYFAADGTPQNPILLQ